MLHLLGGAWAQLIMWTLAAGMVFYLSRLMAGTGAAWSFISAGIFLIGVRIGYKLLPFYKMNEYTQASRYVIGIIGVTLLFIGLRKYCVDNLRPMFRSA